MTQAATLATEAPPAPVESGAPARVERWSARVFAAAVVAAFPLLLWFGRDHWFFLDDWWALTRDGLTAPGYLDDHNGHWSTLLWFDFRLNFELWGLSTYLPYQVPVVLAHLGAAVLVRQVMRRLGVRGWIATAAALAFLLFGTGRENMLFAFQFSQTGSVLCGLGMFLLADGPRSVTRRDWLALGLGVVGLMTSGIFLPFVVGFGVTTLLRRGVRVTAFYALPLGAIFTAWYLAYGHEGAAPLEATGQTLRFAVRMFWASFDALAQGGIGALLVGVAAVGLAAALLRARRSGKWAEAALPLGLAVGWAAFAVLTAAARANVGLTADTHDAGRYLHVGSALLLPLVAAGAEVLARRQVLLGVAALIPLAIGLPGNVDKLAHTEPFLRGDPQLVFAMAHSPFVDNVPPGTTPPMFGPFNGPLTTRWLAQQAAAGRIPEPDGSDRVRDLTAANWLVLAQKAGPGNQPDCPELTDPVAATLRSGDQIGFTGTVTVSLTDGTQASYQRRFVSREGSMINAQAGPVDVVVRPGIGQPPGVCIAPGVDRVTTARAPVTQGAAG
jgi:hypothetical protein